jgi:hypothetical protein
LDFNPSGKYYTICGPTQNVIYNYENYNEIFRLSNDKYRSLRFLNKGNKHFLGIGTGFLFKLLRFDFDSLSTGVEIKEVMPLIYPNPSNEFANIPTNSEIVTKVTLTDNSGRDFPAIYSIETSYNSDSIRLNLTKIPHGTYFITLQTSNSQRTYKLIKGE